MRLKEGEPHTPMVYFCAGPGECGGGSIHLIPQELAERLRELDWSKGSKDWHECIRELWLCGPGRAMNSAWVAEIFADKEKSVLTAEMIKRLPAASYITCKGKVVPNPRETTIYDILEPELPFSLRLTFFRTLLKKWLFLSAV